MYHHHRERVVVLFLILKLIAIDCSPELKLIHVLFRHGEKVPHREYQNYPLDPHFNHSYFPMDSGDLTNEGKLREYKIGTMLYARYGNFLGSYYQPSLISARSTDVARAQMSLQLVLAGLFPPNKDQTWNTHLPWIPVSTVSVPYERDSLLFPHLCPEYAMEYKKFLRQSTAKKIISKYNETMKYLTEHTGKQVNTTSSVYYLYNLFKEQAAENLELPKWTKNIYPNPMKEITALDFHLRSFTTKLKRLNGGVLLRDVVESIKALQTDTLQPRNRKAFLYSAHEVNVAAFAKTLGTNEPAVPMYGSTIILETLKDDIEQYYIRVLLWTGVTERLIPQTIPNCTEFCPLEDFLKILHDVIPTADEADCYNERKLNFTSSTSYRIIHVNLLLLLSLFLAIF